MSYQATQQIKAGYIECMIWADSPTDEDSIEIEYDDISDSLNNIIVDDIEKFVSLADKLINEVLEVDGYNLENVGHDFWLTRNGHGAGFWDGDLPNELGDKLTTIAESFKTFNLWVNDSYELEGEQI